MLLTINANEFSTQNVFISLAKIPKEEIKARTNNDGTPKLAPNGSPTFSTGLKVLTLKNGTPTSEVRGATVNVCQPINLDFSATYKPEGRVWVTHYLTNAKQLGVSITCEKLVPVRSSSLPPMPTNDGGKQ